MFLSISISIFVRWGAMTSFVFLRKIAGTPHGPDAESRCSQLSDFRISIQSIYFPVTRHHFQVFASCFANNFYDFQVFSSIFQFIPPFSSFG